MSGAVDWRPGGPRRGERMRLPPLAPGDVYGRFTVLRRHDTSGSNSRWLCRCECGTEKLVPSHSLRSGHSRSCGCLVRENMSRVGKLGLKDGWSRDYRGTKEYSCWAGMRGRCRNPRNKNWENYGGRGIGMCERWMNFEHFLADMGPCPDKSFSLDRIDNDRGYEPGNVRWASMAIQRRNQRSRVLPIVAPVLMRQMRLRGALIKDIAHAFGWGEKPTGQVCLGKSYRDAVAQIASGVLT